jgi:hypothetical protein
MPLIPPLLCHAVCGVLAFPCAYLQTKKGPALVLATTSWHPKVVTCVHLRRRRLNTGLLGFFLAVSGSLLGGRAENRPQHVLLSRTEFALTHFGLAIDEP